MKTERGTIEDALAKLLTVAGLVCQVVTCGACRQKNRVSSGQVSGDRKPRCGKCGLPL